MAIVDYYRAFVHETRWVAEDLIGIAEIEILEANLIAEWEGQFEWMKVELGDAADEKTMRAAGRSMLHQLLDRTELRVRPQYDDPFFVRGMRHGLADVGKIGWHPDFRSRLEMLLKVPVS
nr:ABC-three component system protein [Protofrankia coriariae]